jgi:hypothetical protein
MGPHLPLVARARGRSDAAFDRAHLRPLEHGDDWSEYLLHNSPQSAAQLRSRLSEYRLITPYEDVDGALAAGFGAIALGTTGYLFRVGEALTGLPVPHISRAWVLPTVHRPGEVREFA